MNPEVALLFLNAGRRVELIRGFRAAMGGLGIKGRIVATDINGLAPALYVGDSHHLTPRSREPDFVECIRDICLRERVNLIVPLIDPDLLILAQNREAIEATGTRVLLSGLRTIELCCDKRETCWFLKTSGFLTPQILSLEDARRHDFPLFIKPRGGSASIDAHRIDDPDELEFFARHVKESVIQEFIEGKEITTDVFSDWSGEPLMAVPRRRLRVRAGEVSVGRVERNPELESLCMSVAKCLATVGPVNIQVMQTREAIYITEINPRFGGGCTLSVAAGAPFAEWTIRMAMRLPLSGSQPEVRDGLTLMRFDDSYYCPAERIAQ